MEKSNRYYIQLQENLFMGGVQFLVANQMAFKRVLTTKEAYTFWQKKFATEVLPFIKTAFPNAKVICRQWTPA